MSKRPSLSSVLAVVAALSLAACAAEETRPTLRRQAGTTASEDETTSAGTKQDERTPKQTPDRTEIAPVVTGTTPAPATPAAPVTPPPPLVFRDRLDADQKLAPGERLVSKNLVAEAVYQGDGNFVVYGPNGALFSTNTANQPTGEVVMQGDGNFVLYHSNAPHFDTRTQGNPGAFIVMQNDCNLVVYSAAGQPLFATNTTCEQGG